jgi:hypothetical protein
MVPSSRNTEPMSSPKKVENDAKSLPSLRLRPNTCKEVQHYHPTRQRIGCRPFVKWLSIFSIILILLLRRFPLPPTSKWLLPDATTTDRGAVVEASPYAGTFHIPIDHFNSTDSRTFKNRYWMHDKYYKPGGPVFFFDCGEKGFSDNAASRLLDGDSVYFAPLELARRYNGIVILWEHRFYGKSMPFEFNERTGIALAEYDAYKYLTNEQALEDVVYFATNFRLAGYDRTPTAQLTPWVWIGGSYAGIRAAMIRQRNPDVFFASWASSAPVEAQVEMPVYYNPIQQVMPVNCSKDVHAGITYADDILMYGSDDQVSILKRAIFLTSEANPSSNLTNPDIHPESLSYSVIASILAYVFQDSAVTFQAFGYEASLGKFCNQLESWNPSNFTNFTLESPSSVLTSNSGDGNITSAGIAATHGAEKAFYAFIHATIQKGMSDYASHPGRVFEDPQDRMSWVWQLCSQFAQFQVSSYPSPTNMISRFYNITGILDHFCHGRHPYAPAVPDVGAILKYGGWNMRPSNVMWTNGAWDPFRTLGVHADTNINPDAPNRQRTTKVPPCNVPPPGDAVFGLTYDGTVHVTDIIQRRGANMTGPLALALELFSEALDVWLECFEPSP